MMDIELFVRKWLGNRYGPGPVSPLNMECFVNLVADAIAQDRKERGDVADGSGVVERLKKLAEKYEYFALEYDVGGWAIEVRDEVADLHLQTKDFPTILEALEAAEKEES